VTPFGINANKKAFPTGEGKPIAVDEEKLLRKNQG
jgi:hypothetical protein